MNPFTTPKQTVAYPPKRDTASKHLTAKEKRQLGDLHAISLIEEAINDKNNKSVSRESIMKLLRR